MVYNLVIFPDSNPNDNMPPEYVVALNNAQHEYMTTQIDYIADALYAWAISTNTNDGNSNYNDAQFSAFDSNPNDGINDGLKEYCKIMAWGLSLQQTQAFQNVFSTDAERNRIISINAAEALCTTIQGYTNYGNNSNNEEPCNY